MNEFQYVSFAQDVIFAPGSLARLGSLAEGYGWQRLLLCTNPSMHRLGTITRLENALGTRLAAVYDGKYRLSVACGRSNLRSRGRVVVEATAIGDVEALASDKGLQGGRLAFGKLRTLAHACWFVRDLR